MLLIDRGYLTPCDSVTANNINRGGELKGVALPDCRTIQGVELAKSTADAVRLCWQLAQNWSQSQPKRHS